ncbi:hypothetical protein P186_1997 [Pyrobaculum ferrireducens]|uniref:Uncharacterized protein n=1 Tax=Pyrobaculum ferrireducens TaxID=1104324 RepID=G7VI33_9CREN|nr:hypothetical protein P186_1997 [Pyrobaculum ferrireducens]
MFIPPMLFAPAALSYATAVISNMPPRILTARLATVSS